MTSTLVDLVKITSNTTGTGALTLGTAVPGYRGLEALTNGATYSYSIQQDATWEYGTATYLADTTQLVRSPIGSSDGGTAINLGPNASVSFVVLAEDLTAIINNPDALLIVAAINDGSIPAVAGAVNDGTLAVVRGAVNDGSIPAVAGAVNDGSLSAVAGAVNDGSLTGVFNDLANINAAPGYAASAAADAADTAADRVYIENNIINPTPRQPAALPMTWIGQSAADMSTDSGKYVTVAAGSLGTPLDGSDWFMVFHHDTGQQIVSTTSLEVLAANSGTFVSGSGGNCAFGRTTLTTTLTEGAWRPRLTLNRGNVDAVAAAGAVVSPDSYTGPLKFGHWCEIFGMKAGIPHYAAYYLGPDGPQVVRQHYASVIGYNTFRYPAAQYTDGTVTRTSNVLTYAHSGLSTATYPVGKKILINSVDHPEVNGEYVVVSVVLGSLTVAAPGANFTISGANASLAAMRPVTDVFTALGGLAALSGTRRYNWSGGIQRVENRWGSLVTDSAGFIDLSWLARYAQRRIKDADIPGAKHFGASANGAGGMTVDSDGTITTAVTVNGTLGTNPQLGADWIVLDAWDGHAPFASDYDPATGTATKGTVRIGATALGAIGGIYAYVDDGTNAISPQILAAPSIDQYGRCQIVIPNVPNGVGYYLNLIPSAQGAGSYSMRWGPFTVGPVTGFINQSTDNVLANPSNTGATLSPIDTTVGIGTIGDVAGYLADSGAGITDVHNKCRLARKRMGTAGQAGDGMMAYSNTFVGLLNASTGKAAAGAAYMLCRSGHPAESYWGDRQTLINGIGTATANVVFNGTWFPHPLWTSQTIIYTEHGTVNIYRGGTFAQVDPTSITSPYVLTGGQLVGQVSTTDQVSGSIYRIVGAVTGTFDYDTGVFSITDPVGGALYIQGKMQIDTPSASVGPSRLANDGFTTWGDDAIIDSGHISNMLRAMNGATAFHWSWTNYLLPYAVAHTQAQVDAKVAFDIEMVRKRINLNYPQLANKLWVVGSDMRTTATQAQYGEHAIRLALQKYAKNTPNTKYSIGAITCDMNQLGSPHPGTLPTSGQLAGTTYAHGMARVFGLTGAKAEEVYITSAVRSADGTYFDLTFNCPAGANLTCSDTTKIEGLFFAPANDTFQMTLVDVNGGTYTTQLIAVGGFSIRVRVTKASGTFPPASSMYWNTNIGWVLTDTTLAAETTRLNRTLSLDTDGYNSIRPGQPITFNPVHVLASQG